MCMCKMFAEVNCKYYASVKMNPWGGGKADGAG